MKKRSIKVIFAIVKISISIILVYYLADSISSNQSILDSLQSAKLEWLAYATILMIPNVLLQAVKWWVLLRQIDDTITFWAAAGSTLGGLSLGFLTPGRIGEIAKGLFIGHIDRLKITGLAMIDRIFNMLAISFLGLLAITILLEYNYNIPIMVYLPIAAISILMMFVIIYIFLHPRYLKALYNKFAKINQLRTNFLQFFSAIKDLRKRSMINVLFLATLIQVLIATQFIFMIYAFVDTFSMLDGFTAAFSTAFTKAVLPISIADIGVRETAADLYFGFFVKDRAGILNGSILLFFVNVVFPALCGLIMLPKLNFQKDIT